jgi:Methyltransferase FkbM domain
MIRLGPRGDGGYLVPDDLVGISACFSPGVASLSGFERDCAERGMQVFMADRSVDGPAEMHESFHFTKKFVGATTNDGAMTMDDWVREAIPESDDDLLLQMDIEGSEYETFLSTSDSTLRRFRIIATEFHDLDKVFNRPFFSLIRATVDKLLQTHVCVHVHPNNYLGVVRVDGLEVPKLAEFTFLRKDRFRDQGPARVFPHPLDSDNTPNAHVSLPKCWYD